MPTALKDDDDASRDKRRAQLLKGIAELALLSLLANGPEYGLQILDSLRSDAGLDLAEGTLYPLLYRLEKSGLIAAEWRLVKEASHPRKYYKLTPLGTAELKTQADDWLTLSRKLNAFLTRRKS